MEEFVVGFKLNHRFNHLVAGNFTLEGTGAAVILGALLMGNMSFMLAGLIMTLAGAFLLFADLGNPLKSWRSIFKPGRSWISRGALFLIGLTSCCSLLLIYPSTAPPYITFFFLWATAVFALLIMLYTGFLISSMKSVPFWNSSFLPLLFLLHSLTSGTILLHFLSATGSEGMTMPLFFHRVEMTLLITALALTTLYIVYSSTTSRAAKESVRILTRGNMRVLFILAGLVGGLLMPVVLLMAGRSGLNHDGETAYWLLCFCLIFRMIGDYGLRLSILRTGVYEPVLA